MGTNLTKSLNKGVLFIFLSTIMFGSYGVWSKLIGSSMGSLFQGWTRGLILSIILLPILLKRKELIPISKKDWKYFTVFSIFTAATQAPLFYAFTHMDIGSASLLFFVTVLITMYIVGIFFLKEDITFVKIISFILAFIGLSIMFKFSVQKFSLLASSMAILNGVASGGEISFSKKLTGDYSPLYVTFMSWIVIFPTNLVLSLLIGERQVILSFSQAWFWQLCYSIVSLFAFWFVINGVKYIEASIAGLIGLLEVVFSVIFGILLFSETFTLRIATGAFFILIASALPHIKDILIKENK